MSDYIIVSVLYILNLKGVASAQLGVMRTLLVFSAPEYGILRFHPSDVAAQVWSICKAIHASDAVGMPPPSGQGSPVPWLAERRIKARDCAAALRDVARASTVGPR